MTPDYRIAMAAGLDAGNRSARRAGRASWTETDWNEAARVTAEIMACLVPAQYGEMVS